MSSFREIINSLFDSRSSGSIIMNYIETPKEEYKKIFNQQIQAIKDKVEDDDVYNPRENPCLHFPYIMKPVGLNDEEINQVVEVLLEKLGCDGLYPQYKQWIKENYGDERVAYDNNGNWYFVQTFDLDEIFNWLQRDKLWNLCDNPLTLRFKLLCDYTNIIHVWKHGPNKDRKKIAELKLLQEIESRVKSAFNKIVIKEMWRDGTLTDEEQYDSRTDEEMMIDYCMKYFYYNKEIK